MEYQGQPIPHNQVLAWCVPEKHSQLCSITLVMSTPVLSFLKNHLSNLTKQFSYTMKKSLHFLWFQHWCSDSFQLLKLNALDDRVGNRCSTYQSGDLAKTDKAVDGIFGFGQGALSVISQLSYRGITPKVFSHCLKGDGNGGGILVLGEILEPSIVYSPLVPSQYVSNSLSYIFFIFALIQQNGNSYVCRSLFVCSVSVCIISFQQTFIWSPMDLWLWNILLSRLTLCQSFLAFSTLVLANLILVGLYLRSEN